MLVSLRQDALYAANAKVLLSRENLVSSLTGAPDPNANQDADRVAATQAQLARQPTVAARVVNAVGLARSTDALLRESAVSGEPGTDFLVFRVTDRDPTLAQRLAVEYARQFVNYRREADTATIVHAREEIDSRIRTLARENKQTSAVYADLVDKREQLRTMEILRTANTVQIESASRAEQIAPHTVRNGILGFVLGLILAVGLAFVRETMDTRIRSADEVGQRLELPLLARIPAPPRRLAREHKLVTIESPNSVEAEAYRVLRTNFTFVNHDRGAQVVMVTSAIQGEGKSTTIANLAVTFARSGLRVALVDLDLRRPFLDRFFDIDSTPGFTNFALGNATLADAIRAIPLSRDMGSGTSPQATLLVPSEVEATATVSAAAEGSGALAQLASMRERGDQERGRVGPRTEPEQYTGNGTAADLQRQRGVGGLADSTNGGVTGSLHLIPSGPLPPNPGEFIGTPAITMMLDFLRSRADLVLVDTAPLLNVGDAIALSAQVDALFLVARLNVLRRPTLAELNRVLGTCPSSKLGFVIAGAELEDEYGYGYHQRSYGRMEEELVI